MKLSALVSPGTWDLLERLRPHLDVTVDLFDTTLEPVLPERNDRTSQALRRMPLDEGAIADGTSSPRYRFITALRTANSQLFSAAGLQVGLFPLRHDRILIGILAAASPIASRTTTGGDDADRFDREDQGPTFFDHPDLLRRQELLPYPDIPTFIPEPAANGKRALEDPVIRRVEQVGWSLRAAIESDIETHEQLGAEQQRSRWLATTLRFLEHLHACESDDELADALVQAAAIWGDVDARLYRSDLSGGYALHSALPAIAADAMPRVLPGSVADGHPGVTRITSIAELEQLGWRAVHNELLLMPLPVPVSRRPDWMLAVAGSVDARFERVLMVACRTLSTRFDQLTARRADALRARLSTRVGEPRTTLPAHAAGLLAEIAVAVGATHARLLARDSADGPPRTLAAIGGSAIEFAPSTALQGRGRSLLSGTRLVLPLEAGLQQPALLDLGTTGEHPFGPASVALARTGANLIGAWLVGALQGLSAGGFGLDTESHESFEARIRDEIARARRFGLSAGLILVDTRASSREQHALLLQPLIGLVRSHLRAADLLGRLADGELAALLVHTDEPGLIVVLRRLEEELGRQMARAEGGPAVLGVASYPSAGETVQALLTVAREDRARKAAREARIRLRRICRDVGPLRGRVAVESGQLTPLFELRRLSPQRLREGGGRTHARRSRRSNPAKSRSHARPPVASRRPEKRFKKNAVLPTRLVFSFPRGEHQVTFL